MAIFLDATVVRHLLVPALMELMGSANRWLPKSLKRWLPALDMDGGMRYEEPTGVLAPGEA
ncbi:MAG TPA: hypothetical protein VJP07_03330 [Dehalococcoidia bacterium]|nr:hypothetical protein [Dehalococcoidia bacterium]